MDKNKQKREEKIRELLGEEDELLGKAYDGRLVRRLAEYLQPYRVRLVTAVTLMIITALLAVSRPLIVGRAIDRGINAGDSDTLRFWTIAFILASLGEWVGNRFRIALMAYIGTKVVADLRSQLFRHLQALSLSFFNNYSVGRLMSRLISDVGVVQDFITWSITGLFRSAFMLMGIILFMLALNWQLALVTFAVMPAMSSIMPMAE